VSDREARSGGPVPPGGVQYNTLINLSEHHMYIGGGILGTVLIVLLVLWLLGAV
jgi:hypothetical protein